MINFIRDWLNKNFSDPQVIILAILLISILLIVVIMSDMLAPVFASLVVAYLLDGMVSWGQRLKIPRIISVILVFLFFMVCMLFLVIGLLPKLSRQIGQLFQELPSMLSAGQQTIIQLAERYPDVFSQQQIQQLIGALSSELTNIGQSIISFSLASVRGLISFVVYLILVPLLAFFFLKDKTKILQWTNKFLPENRALANEVWREVNQQIINYIRGKIWEIVIIWVVSYITFLILGLQYSMLISLVVGLSVLIPYIGAILAYLPVLLIGFFQWGVGSNLLYISIAYLVIQAIDGNILAPILLSEVVHLHPIAIIVAVLVFGGIWGFWGLIFAIPLATLVHAVLNAWFRTREKAKQSEMQGAELPA